MNIETALIMKNPSDEGSSAFIHQGDQVKIVIKRVLNSRLQLKNYYANFNTAVIFSYPHITENQYHLQWLNRSVTN